MWRRETRGGEGAPAHRKSSTTACGRAEMQSEIRAAWRRFSEGVRGKWRWSRGPFEEHGRRGGSEPGEVGAWASAVGRACVRAGRAAVGDGEADRWVRLVRGRHARGLAVGCCTRGGKG